MRVGVIGINHKLANVKLRELLAQACQRTFMVGGSRQEGHTFVLLSTCNRTEVYFTSADPASTHTYLLHLLRSEVKDEFDQRIYSYFGRDCFLHLSRVTAGLDSAIVAETEIQGQVKAAYENACSHIELPGELHYLFQKALSIGKKVRATLPMGRGMPDLEHAIFNAGLEQFKDPQDTRILFVGASGINQKILGFFKGKQLPHLTLCNRSNARAQEVASQHSIEVLEWNRLHEWVRYDWVIFGTKSPNYLIKHADLPRECCGRKLIIDLCVPRNVDPRLELDARVSLFNIDRIHRILKVRRQQMADSLTQAEKLVSEASQRQIEIFKAKEQGRLSQRQALGII